TVGRDYTKEEVQAIEDDIEEHTNTNTEISGCKRVEFNIDGNSSPYYFTCQFKADGKWYIFGD
ncbi:MAG: hypothetical protein PHW90_02160, partial [Bacilli bacterium]|nr:hypothetical protein [Bacilli bacterium]